MVTAQQLYGVDLKLENKDLVISASGGHETTSGNNNILQSIMNRLTTEQRSLAYNSNYGANLSLAIGEKNVFLKQQIIKTIITSAVKQDPRVYAITDLQVTMDSQRPDTYYVALSVQPIGNNSQVININFVYPFFINQTNVKVLSEAQTSIDKYTVDTSYNIYSISGVWLATDLNKTGVNYYQGTSSGFSGTTITLSYELPMTTTSVVVDYNKNVESNIGGIT